MAATCLRSMLAPSLRNEAGFFDSRAKSHAVEQRLLEAPSSGLRQRGKWKAGNVQGVTASARGVPGAARGRGACTEEEPGLRHAWGTDPIGWRGFDDWRSHTSSLICATATEASTSEEDDLATIIDGQAIAAQIRSDIAEEVLRMKSEIGKVPGLAVVLVGSRKDSQTYVRMKQKACEEAGIQSLGVDLPEDSTELEVLQAVEELNADPRVHGVLVQLPLPKHMNEERVVGGVSVHKDVDGFHPLNMGRLAMAGREPLFVPCTPKGCIELLLRSGVPIQGKRAVVIGRSNVVGMPAALLLQRHNATVTIVHSYTPDPAAVTREADIVVAAVGVANLVRGSWLKPGAAVIDVGINAVEDATTKRGYRLVGDVCFEEARRVAGAITPVPRGVGPMTIAMLLQNTLVSAKRAYGLQDS